MKTQLIVQRYLKVGRVFGYQKSSKMQTNGQKKKKKIEVMVMETVHQGEFITEICGWYEYA